MNYLAQSRIFNIKTILLCLLAIVLYDAFLNQAFAIDFEWELESIGTIEKKGNEGLSSLTANLAILFLIIANVEILARYILAFGSPGNSKKSRRSSIPLLHYSFNALAFIATLFHAHWASATSVIFIASEVAMVLLGIAGILLLLLDRSEEEKQTALIKGKKILFCVLFLLLVVGHLVIDN